MPAQKLHVTVAIATRGRPEGCQRLVEAVLAQTLPTEWELRVIVVDNDPVRSELKLPRDQRVEVVHEPEQGIPFARNRGVDQALPWADVIVFVDDDELPVAATWLLTLVQGLEVYRADIVSGPIRPVFSGDTPDWIQRQPVFQRRTREAGEYLSETYTGNTAVVADIFLEGRRFSPLFRNTGGSDTQLFRAAKRDGAIIRWVENAPVVEFVPLHRASIRWVLARSFRIGANRVQFLRAEPRAAAQEWLILLGGSATELALALSVPILALASRRRALLILGRAFRGLGTMSALVGFRYAPYRSERAERARS